MKMKINIILLCIFIFPFSVNALTSSEYKNRNVCSNYEVAIARERKGGDPTSTYLDTIRCVNNYNEALNIMNNSDKDSIILERKNGTTKIINAKNALVDLTLNGDNITYYYPNPSTNTSDNYMVNSASTGSVDGAFIDFDNTSRRAKVKVAGYTGWVNEQNYEIVPIAWVYSISFYKNVDGGLRHHFAHKISEKLNSYYGISIGPNIFNDKRNYYSYDGHYFYDDQYKMIGDYKNNNYNNSVNKNNPYYNYYEYLPNHSKTNYSSSNINKYIREGLGITRSVYGNTLNIKGSFNKDEVSKLYGMGTYYIYAQEQYGANAILSFGLNRNEGADGRSKIAVSKNNGYGQGAVDSSPFGSSYGFLTYEGSIYNHAQHFVTDLYQNANHSYYNGGHFGNKQGGWNVRYASDPFWGEKAASYYYRFDKYYGFQDYNFYQLAVNTGTTTAKSSPSNNSKNLYTIKDKEIPVIIIGEVNGDTVNGSNKWYKIISDVNLDSNKNQRGFYSEYFDWDNSIAYVPSSYFKKINNARDGIKSYTDVYPYQGMNYKYSYYNDGNKITPKVGKITKDTKYYYDGALMEQSNKTVLKDKYVMVYDNAIDSNGRTISYLATSDYNLDQKEWIPAESVTLVGGAYGKQTVIPTGYSSNVFENASEHSKRVSGIYDGCYLPVLEEIKGNDGKTYLKVPVSLASNSNNYGYTLKTDSDAYIEIYNDKQVVINNPPVINASDKEIFVGDKLELKQLATAQDTEDGDITNKITITGSVDINKLGVYKITYKVQDSKGLETSKDINITVIKDEEPVINANDVILTENSIFDAKKYATAYDNEDKDITNKIVVIYNNVNTKVAGEYKVTYKITDSKNNSVSKDIKVTVEKEKLPSEKIKKDGEFYLDNLVFDKTKNKYLISGYLIIKNINNRVADNIKYELILKNKDTNKTYNINIDRWLKDVPYALGTENNYDYNGAWFKGYIDFNNVVEGDYDLYMKATSNNFYSEEKVTNIFNKDIDRRSEDGDKGYNFRVELSSKYQEITLNVREKLITTNTSNTYRNMINNYDDMRFIDNKLKIVGTSYNYGISYDKTNFIERKLILENTKTFKQYTYDIGATDNGSYKVTSLDNMDKTYAWYNNSIDVSNLEKGTYQFLIYTKTKDVTDYGEIIDTFASPYDSEATINEKKYKIEVNKNRNNRIELVIF